MPLGDFIRYLQRGVLDLFQPFLHLPGLVGVHGVDSVVALRDDPVQHDGVLKHGPAQHGAFVAHAVVGERHGSAAETVHLAVQPPGDGKFPGHGVVARLRWRATSCSASSTSTICRYKAASGMAFLWFRRQSVAIVRRAQLKQLAC
jgi:hypothetical protein